jgi:hypothetical protein
MLHILASAAAAKMGHLGFPKDFPCPKAPASLVAFSGSWGKETPVTFHWLQA